MSEKFGRERLPEMESELGAEAVAGLQLMPSAGSPTNERGVMTSESTQTAAVPKVDVEGLRPGRNRGERSENSQDGRPSSADSSHYISSSLETTTDMPDPKAIFPSLHSIVAGSYHGKASCPI